VLGGSPSSGGVIRQGGAGGGTEQWPAWAEAEEILVLVERSGSRGSGGTMTAGGNDDERLYDQRRWNHDSRRNNGERWHETRGGTTATGGSNMSMQDLVKAMSPGWNLGNSFDGSPK